MNDAALVGLALADPSQGVAAIYDRYGTSLYNYCYSILRSQADAGDALHEAFVTVMNKLGQLRDPDKLRPWLYAVARNQCFKAHRRRNRERPEDPFETGEGEPVMAASTGESTPTELVSLVWEATAGLSDIDRSVLELNIRHQLDGEELAASLGVPGPKCSVLLHRAKDRLKTAVGALIVAKVGVDDCTELAGIVAGNDFSPLIRKRVARHVKGCATCEDTESRHRPEAYLAVVPLLSVPDHVRDGVLGAIQTAALPPASGTDIPSTETAPSATEGRPTEAHLAKTVVVDLDPTVWDGDGFPELHPHLVEQTAVASSRRSIGAAIAVGCVIVALAMLVLFNPFRREITVAAGPAPAPTELADPEFLPTSTPPPPTVAAAPPEPGPVAATEPTMTPTPTPSPTATPVPVPPPAVPTAPSATPTPTVIPTATVTPLPTPTEPPPTPSPTATTPPPSGTPNIDLDAPTVGPVIQNDFIAPTVSSFSVGCGDPFNILVTVADNNDPSPTVDLEVTWEDESDPAVPLTNILGTTYRATVPRSELVGEHIPFFITGTIRDSSGNVRNVDLTDDCTIIG